jgi:TPR repeat protein
LQYLYPYSEDTTARSYEEKLQKFLTAVLLGDDLAEQARAAFDAYIFLSYRKKDRQYANELMRLIHQNDFCRDVAIWYDEFLIPGENFDKAIAKAMENSALFALVVTPNLLEEHNYVLENEYPAAQKSGITILPAEMVKTDQTALGEKYPSLPTPANAYNETDLAGALSTALSHIAKRENNDPKHLFFIGLAYLGGIDVEIDRERALRLIAQASNGGLPEATEKLANMYRFGEGVARDPARAFFYRERLIEQYQLMYESSPAKETFFLYLHAILDLAKSYADEYDFENAQRLYQTAYTVSDSVLGQFDNAPERQKANALKGLARCNNQRGNHSAAKSCYEESLALLFALAKNNSSFSAQISIVSGYIKIAATEQKLGNYRATLSRCAEAETMLQKIEDGIETFTPEMTEFSYCYDTMSSIMQGMIRFKDALRYAEKSMLWCTRLAAFYHPIQALENECYAHSTLADNLRYLQRAEEAEVHYRKAFTLAKEYFEKDGGIRAEECYASMLTALANIAQNKKDYSTAERMYAESYERFSRLAKRTFSIASVSKQGLVLHHQSSLAEAQGDLDRAECLLKQEIEHYTSALRRMGNLHWRNRLALAYSHYASKLTDSTQRHKQIELYCASAKEHERIYKTTHDIRSLSIVARTQQKVGDLYVKMGDEPNALRFYEQAMRSMIQLPSPNRYELLVLIAAAEPLAARTDEKTAFLCNLLLIYCCGELLKTEQNDRFNRIRENAKTKVRHFAALYENSSYAFSAYDEALDAFMDKQSCIARKIALELCSYLAKHTSGEQAHNYYTAALRQCDALLRETPNDETLLTERSKIQKKLNDLPPIEEHDDFDDMDIEALVASVFEEE